MPEPFLDDPHINAGLEGQGRPRVSEVVDADARESVACDVPIEFAAEPVWVVRPTIEVAEDEVVDAQSTTERQPFLRLAGPFRLEDSDGAGIQVDHASLARLGARGDVDAVVDGRDRLADRRAPRPQVNVLPAQAQGLAAPRARGPKEKPGRVVVAALLVIRPRRM
jgi:hypothetical protein